MKNPAGMNNAALLAVLHGQEVTLLPAGVHEAKDNRDIAGLRRIPGIVRQCCRIGQTKRNVAITFGIERMVVPRKRMTAR